MFTKSELKTFLESSCPKARVLKLNFASPEKFFVSLRCSIDADAGVPLFKVYFADFIKKFGIFTSTTWIVRAACPKVVRFVYRKVFVCHLSGFNKKKTCKQTDRNQDCKAQIEFKVKKTTEHTLKTDPLLREKLNLSIKINFEHTHLVYDRAHFNLLRGDEDRDKKFLEYFDKGFGATAAKNFHEMVLIEQYGNDSERLSNSNINPTTHHIHYLFGRYKTEREREIRGVDSLMADRKADLENAGGTLIYTDNAEIALVITPFMKRVFLELGSDVVIVESTLTNKFIVTFFYVPSKVGALPIACALHTSQDEENFSQIFLTVKITIENYQFGQSFDPKIFMSNYSKELTNAAAAIFPNARRLLIPHDICRNFWVMLCDSDNNFSRKKRHPLMALFRRMIYADSMAASARSYTELLHSVHAEETIKEYVEDVWSRSDEWSHKDVHESSERPVLEASIIFIKELLIQRCKCFNVFMTVDVVVDVIDAHFRRILETYVTGQESLEFLTKFLLKVKDIIGFNSETQKVSTHLYRMTAQLKTKKAYSFRTDTFCCDCSSGMKGQFCEHLTAIINAVNTEFKALPSLDEKEREFFAKLSGVDIAEIEKIKKEVVPVIDDVDTSDEDKEFQKDFSGDDNDVDPDYQPDEEASNDYYAVDVKPEKRERNDPLEEFLLENDMEIDNDMPSQSQDRPSKQPIAPKEIEIEHQSTVEPRREEETPPVVEPELTPGEFKAVYEKTLKELNAEFRRLSKLFKDNANRSNLTTVKRLATELAKIRPVERVNLKNLFVELNEEDEPDGKKMRIDE